MNNMQTKDFRITKNEGYVLYSDKYHELSRKMFIEVTDIYDEDINFVVALYPPFSYNFLEAGDKIRLSFKMKTGRNAKSGILNNYVYCDEVVALKTTSSLPWMSPAEMQQTKIEDEQREKAYKEEIEEKEKEAMTDGTALFEQN